MKKLLLLFIALAINLAFVQNAYCQQPDIIFCSAPWCSGCKKMKPVIKKLEEEGYIVERPKQSEWKDYGVRYIPTTIIYNGYREVKRYTGYVSAKQIKQHISQQIRYDIAYAVGYGSESRQIAREIRKLKGYSIHRITQFERAQFNVTEVPTIILYSNGVEIKRFHRFVHKAEIESYLTKVKIVLAGYDDRRIAIAVIGRILKKEGVRLIHLPKEAYSQYGIKSTPTIIFFEDGVEKYRLCTSS